MNNIEKKAICLFDALYGRNFLSRTKKLREECLELVEAIDNLSISTKDGELDKLLDEMGDVEAVLSHTANIINTTRDELLCAAVDKVEKRQINPNYKRS